MSQLPLLQSVFRTLNKPRSNNSPLVWGVWLATTIFPERCGRDFSGSTNSHWKVVLDCSAIGMLRSYEP